MNLLNETCGQCGAIDKRMVIEVCGHQKCRQCFIQEETNCLQCEAQNNPSGIAIRKLDVVNYSTGINEHIKTDIAFVQDKHLLLKTEKTLTKTHQCTQCQKVFSKLSYLKHHLDSHTSSTHQCSYCYKVFGNRLILKKHEYLHTAQPSLCSHCKKLFCRKDSLLLHIARKHTNILMYKCEQCSKSYPSKSALNQHLLKHESKKYCCNQCGKCYQRNSTLTSHVKRHFKSHEYRCKTCGKFFSDSVSCTRHESQHQDTHKFRCKLCETITSRKDNMLRHIRNFHMNFTFQESVDIVQHSLVNLPSSYHIFNSNEETKYNTNSVVLKTVENSSVIKCVGNVEPVVVPSVISEKEHKLPLCCFNLDTLADNNKRNHGINNKRLLNIKLYRKILEDDMSVQESVKVLPTGVFEADEKVTLLNNNNLDEKRSLLHWRKSFKNNYELTDT